MKNVLVTAIGSFSADIVIKNLKKIGMGVVGCDIYPKPWIADSLSVQKFYQAPYATDSSKYIEFLKKICVKENISFIFPLTDIEIDVLNCNRQWFEENNVCLCISDKNTIDLCRNKKGLYNFIEKSKLGIKLIPATAFTKDLMPKWDWPVVCKPNNGRSSQGMVYIHNRKEWDALTSGHNLKDYIIQPYIEGPVITVDVIRSPINGNTVAIPRRELLRTLNGAGTSVYVFHDKSLEKACIKLANALNIIGCVNFEWIQNTDGEYYFLECNPRFSGGVKFSCIAGYDCISNHMRCFNNMEIDNFSLVRNQYIARKYEEFVTSLD